jgi:hypothetical protein
MEEAQKAEALARERARADAARQGDRPLWMQLLGILVLGFALQRGAGAVIASTAHLPARIALALGAECLAALVAGALLCLGARAAIPAVIAVAIVSIASAGAQIAAVGAPAAPAALSRALVTGAGAAALAAVLRRHFAARGDARRARR